jgi:hypothetical protein
VLPSLEVSPGSTGSSQDGDGMKPASDVIWSKISTQSKRIFNTSKCVEEISAGLRMRAYFSKRSGLDSAVQRTDRALEMSSTSGKDMDVGSGGAGLSLSGS